MSQKALIAIGVILVATGVVLYKPGKLDSANLTSVKDTLQSSRLSVAARVDATGTSVGGSNVKIYTSASSPYYTISTANLKAQDTVTIGTHAYTVVGIVDSANFTVSPVLITGDTVDGTAIYLKEKPQHVVTFTTATAVPNGFFQILLPSNATTGNDGNPDFNGYDFNTTVDVVGTNATNYTFVTGVATASGGTGCTAPANYHCFEVHYSGNGGVGTAITIKIGNTNGTNTPIAPATGSSHTEGTADTYPFIVKNFAASANPNTATPVDQTTGRIAQIESVRVTATVSPTISFAIAGHAASGTVCGVTPDIDTTTGSNAPLAVPFGTMTLNTFKTAVQSLTVSTNAASGYVVTASENQPLGKNGATSPTIADTTCDAGTCSQTTAGEWATATHNGFGYSLQNTSATTIAFQYNDSAGTFHAKQFADISAAETPQTLFSSTTVANAEAAYVCYRLSVGATQAAGDYENQITYTATGTF